MRSHRCRRAGSVSGTHGALARDGRGPQSVPTLIWASRSRAQMWDMRWSGLGAAAREAARAVRGEISRCSRAEVSAGKHNVLVLCDARVPRRTARHASRRCAALPDGSLSAAPGHTGWLVQVCDSRDCRYAELVREARAEQQAAVAEARRTEAELRTLQVLWHVASNGQQPPASAHSARVWQATGVCCFDAYDLNAAGGGRLCECGTRRGREQGAANK
jgi:hypothetical protein